MSRDLTIPNNVALVVVCTSFKLLRIGYTVSIKAIKCKQICPKARQ